MNRQAHIQNVVEAIGVITREFNIRGNYPFKDYFLGRPHIDVLYLLTQNKQMSIKELSERLNVTSGAVTQFVDFLKEKNLVLKAEKLTDRRVCLVSLTPNAKHEFEKFKEVYQATIARYFDDLGDAELITLSKILHKIGTK